MYTKFILQFGHNKKGKKGSVENPHNKQNRNRQDNSL
jgi:hypothetical protein